MATTNYRTSSSRAALSTAPAAKRRFHQSDVLKQPTLLGPLHQDALLSSIVAYLSIRDVAQAAATCTTMWLKLPALVTVAQCTY